MAHIFAAEYGDAPHHLSLNDWWLPNMGVIEGVAEAATWDSGRLDLHQWTAALHRLEARSSSNLWSGPDGFYSQYARTAYTMCGSLTRFIGETYGKDAIKRVYADGDFARPVNTSLDDLTKKWRAFLAQQTLPGAP